MSAVRLDKKNRAGRDVMTQQIAYVPVAVNEHFKRMQADRNVRLRAEMLMRALAALEVVERYPGLAGELRERLKEKPYELIRMGEL